MADNITLNSGSGGAVLAADDITSVFYQIVKMAYGALDTATLVTAANPLPVDIRAENASVTVDGTVTANLSATDNAVLDTIDAVLDAINAKLVSGTVIGDVNLGAADNAVLDTIDAVLDAIKIDTEAIETAVEGTLTVAGTVTANLSVTDNAVLDTIDAVLDAINAKLVSGTVIGDVNLGATDNAVLDTIDAVLDAINAKLVSGTVIGDVNLGATDNAVLDTIDAVLDAINAKLVSGTVIGKVEFSPETSGGYSRFYDKDLDETAVAVKAAAGQVYAISAFNTTNAPLFLQLFNVAQGSVTVGTTVPDEQYVIPGNADSDGAGFTQNFPHGVPFSTAITAACTTTSEGAAGPAAGGCVIVLHYK